ncbi:hypothetical protein [Gluconobacter oxydans]|uniref:hypothetical protein n=1 Tax=Gluconobacter oxydans TaxID=442 RepID=UPI001CD84804|nr:hypothetical protein [Gluconobacter oxydans]
MKDKNINDVMAIIHDIIMDDKNTVNSVVSFEEYSPIIIGIMFFVAILLMALGHSFPPSGLAIILFWAALLMLLAALLTVGITLIQFIRNTLESERNYGARVWEAVCKRSQSDQDYLRRMLRCTPDAVSFCADLWAREQSLRKERRAMLVGEVRKKGLAPLWLSAIAVGITIFKFVKMPYLFWALIVPASLAVWAFMEVVVSSREAGIDRAVGLLALARDMQED